MTEKKTAEEVREILTRLVLADDLSTTWKIKCHKSTTKIMEIMEAYAAQKIADKMVEERLREELIKYTEWLNNTIWGIDELSANSRLWDEYLKSKVR